MKKILILFVVFGAFACSSIKTAFDYDRQIDFTKYKTYALSSETLEIPVNQLVRDRLISALETELAGKGFTKSDSPDLIVDLTVKAQKKVDATATTSGTGMGYGHGGYGRYGYGGGFSTTQISYDEYTEGTLFITLVDNTSQKIAWQGTGTGVVNENASAEKRDANINYAIKEILKNYPPAKK